MHVVRDASVLRVKNGGEGARDISVEIVSPQGEQTISAGAAVLATGSRGTRRWRARNAGHAPGGRVLGRVGAELHELAGLCSRQQRGDSWFGRHRPHHGASPTFAGARGRRVRNQPHAKRPATQYRAVSRRLRHSAAYVYDGRGH